MNDLVQKVKNWLKENGIGRDCGIVIGVSGGADSLCLLTVLQEAAKENPLRLFAVHVHHGIRGDEADRDAEYVTKLCEKMQIPFLLEKRDVPALARERGETLEEAGRRVRYEILEAVRRQKGADYIAVGHHMEDQAETILFHLLRGTHLNGMGGMQSIQGRVIRPLLSCRKKELTGYLQDRGISWCQDSTNEEAAPARNRIRLEILPILREMQPEIIEVLCMEGKRFQEAFDYLEQEAALFLKTRGTCEKEGLCLFADEVNALPKALGDQVIYKAICQAVGRKRDITGRHVEAVRELLQLQSGKKVMLPDRALALRRYEQLVFLHAPEGEPVLPTVQMRLISPEEREKIEENSYTKCFAYDKMISFPVLRFRMPKDRICLYEDGRGKKLQDYFTDRKIPVTRRDRIPVLAIGSEILWVVGERTSPLYRVGPDTKQVLVVSIEEKNHQTKEQMEE